jgi:cathepsin L
MRVVFSALLCALPVAALKVTSHAEFDVYVNKFNRKYTRGSSEYAERQAVFEEKLRLIEEQNANPERLWDAGLNGLSDWLPSEYEQLLGWRGAARRHVAALGGGGGAFGSLLELGSESMSNKTLAKEINWKKLKMANEVPEQGPCGSCWAVATAAMLTGRYELMNPAAPRSFSIQQLVNCVPNPKACGGTGGCDGATVELGMRYVQEAGLLETDSEPYQAADGHCSTPVAASGFLQISARPQSNGGASLGLTGWRTLPENKARPLMEAVQSGPVAISVGADAWSLYSRGIFDGCKQDTVINHAVTLFGYGEDKGQMYWNIRNS